MPDRLNREISDTANLGLWRLRRRHDQESEQCDGITIHWIAIDGRYARYSSRSRWPPCQGGRGLRVFVSILLIVHGLSRKIVFGRCRFQRVSGPVIAYWLRFHGVFLFLPVVLPQVHFPPAVLLCSFWV